MFPSEVFPVSPQESPAVVWWTDAGKGLGVSPASPQGSPAVDAGKGLGVSPASPQANQKKYLVSGIPTDPLFFKKGKKKKKKGAWFSDGYALFLQRQFGLDVDCMSSERWAWPRHSTPTDRPAVERDSRDTGNKVFLLVGLRGLQLSTLGKVLESLLPLLRSLQL